LPSYWYSNLSKACVASFQPSLVSWLAALKERVQVLVPLPEVALPPLGLPALS
jgi:hypothetical protein